MASHLSAEQMESVKEPLKLCRPSGSSLMPITLRESVEVAKCIWNAAKNGKSSVYPYTHTLQRLLSTRASEGLSLPTFPRGDPQPLISGHPSLHHLHLLRWRKTTKKLSVQPCSRAQMSLEVAKWGEKGRIVEFSMKAFLVHDKRTKAR
ncbi:uncharacterized protein LOC144984183 [Oryzias latipes]